MSARRFSLNNQDVESRHSRGWLRWLLQTHRVTSDSGRTRAFGIGRFEFAFTVRPERNWTHARFVRSISEPPC